MVVALMGLADWEGRQLNVETAYLEADVEEELYIELPYGHRGPQEPGGKAPRSHELPHAHGAPSIEGFRR